MKVDKSSFLENIQILLIINIYLFKISSSANIRAHQHPNPMTLNVTYEFPFNDITEKRLHAKETFNFKNRVKELETKIEKDSQLLKMILNVQNIQIQKMTEVYYLNQALFYHYLIEKDETDQLTQKRNKIVSGIEGDDISKVIRLNNPNRIREFLNGVYEAGMIDARYKTMGDKELFDNFKNILEKAIINSNNKLSTR